MSKKDPSEKGIFVADPKDRMPRGSAPRLDQITLHAERRRDGFRKVRAAPFMCLVKKAFQKG